MNSLMDYISLEDSYKFFYGNSVVYLAVACFFILWRVRYDEISNRTSYSYLVMTLGTVLMVQSIAMCLYSLYNVVVFDYEFPRTELANWLIVFGGVMICFFNGIAPYCLFLTARRQVRSVGILGNNVNRLGFMLFASFVAVFAVFSVILLFSIYSGSTINAYDWLFKLTVVLALSQFLLFLLAIKDITNIVSTLVAGQLFSKTSLTIGVVVFVYLPLLLWPLSLVLVLPLHYINQVVFVFIVHMLSQDRAVSRDFLTGMNNRNELYRYMMRFYERPVDLTSDLNMIFIDINKFKSINDTYGHSMGDKALIAMSNCLKRSAFSKNCFLSRYAGDEFVVVIKEDRENTVKKFIENLTQNIENTNQNCKDPYKLSAAIGYVPYSEEYTTIKDFINAADANMYNVKKNFDDSVIVSTEI